LLYLEAAPQRLAASHGHRGRELGRAVR